MNYIHFIGYDAVHPNDFTFDIPDGYDCYLLLITHTPAHFYIDGEIIEYPTHHAILYPPGHRIWYAACEASYSDDWIRFSSDETFVLNFPLLAHPFPVSDPDYCHNLIQLLTWETSQWSGTSRLFRHAYTADAPASVSSKEELITSQLLRILFLKLHKDAYHHFASPHDHELLMLRRQISNNPQLSWNVREMAESLHISMGHLQLLYKQKFGISCMDDVIDFRLRKAMDLLTYTNQSISEIAEQCGYRNVEHFCRQFRKCIGISPGKFRKSESY